MGKTADLRKLVTAQLNLVQGQTYHKQASPSARYPYKVFDLSRVNLGDIARDDFDLVVELYDHAPDPRAIEEIADQIEDTLDAANLPQTTILPTFYRDSRLPVPEADKDIQHIELHFLVELYKNE